ncbi:hypothetical protein [Rhodococcus sp. NPDC127528]|uniref:DUF7144 family membrane protein n=1 Tax=unclassified Rhodococcus (in: high G+C Gram-positive bacteria) TaxID=192944 RepID=UPI003638051D
MTDHSAANRTDSGVKQGFAAGASIAAAILLLTVGILQIFQGISAVAKDNVLVVGPQYTYQFNITTWGWIHIVVGILIALTGFALLSGATWARIAAIFLAALSIIANFLWLPYYPLWSILIIALDVVVIWAVTTWDTDRV